MRLTTRSAKNEDGKLPWYSDGVSIIKRLFGKGEEGAGELLCPYCERAMGPEHKCTAMTRRFFFGSIVAAGAVAALPVLKAPPVQAWQAAILPGGWEAVDASGSIYALIAGWTHDPEHAKTIERSSLIARSVWSK